MASERKLSEAEQRRLARFNATSDELIAQGYRRANLDVSVTAANVVAVVVMLVLFAAAVGLLMIVHPNAEPFIPTLEVFVVLGVFLVLIVVHELIHGLTWSFFTPNGFKDVEFGVIWNALTPYCTCLAPLRKAPYILGTLMPLLTLGIVPLAVGFVLDFVPLLYLGILMSGAATGDVMIVAKVLGYKQKSDDMLLYDHPVDVGTCIFER